MSSGSTSSAGNASRPTQQSRTASLSQGAGDGQVTLRQSCDGCAAAKVKCNKDHPTCERCASSGASCVYGPSRKHGRLSQRRRQAESYSSGDQQPTAAALPQLQQKQLPGLQLSGTATPSSSSSEHDYLPDWPQSVDEVMHDFDGAMWPNLIDPLDMWTDTLNPKSLAYAGGPVKGLFPTMDDDSIGFHDPNGPTNSMASPSTQSYASYGSTSSSSSTSASLLDLQSIGSTLCSGTVQDGSSTAQKGYFESGYVRGNGGASGCSQLAYLTLSSIQHPQHLGQDASDSPVGQSPSNPFAAATSSLPTLENILHNNRSAVANVLQLLQCSCANNPHNAVLYSSIISKILCQYQIAAGTKAQSSTSVGGGTGPREVSLQARGNATNGCYPFPADPASMVRDAVKIGSFSPDEADQEPMRRVLLLSELNKAHQLVDRLAAVQPEAGGGMDGHPLYTTLGAWLKSELTKTTKTVRDALRQSVATP